MHVEWQKKLMGKSKTKQKGEWCSTSERVMRKAYCKGMAAQGYVKLNDGNNSMRKARSAEAKRKVPMLYCHGMTVDWMNAGRRETSIASQCLTGEGANLMGRKISQHRRRGPGVTDPDSSGMAQL